MALITLVEYAQRNGRDPDSARHKAQRGGFKTAVRMGRDWLIDEDEPYTDRRIVHGNMIGVHRARMEKKAAKAKEKEQPGKAD